jgi:hypothetical protein
VHGLIDYYSVAHPDAGPDDIGRGDIFESQPAYVPADFGLRLTNVGESGEDEPGFELCGRTQDIFQHPPTRRFGGLAYGEALVVAKAKWARPVVVLAQGGKSLLAGPDKARATGTHLCAPIYGADQFSANIRRRLRAYEFPNLFYLPASEWPHFGEGFVRFDHVQAIRQSHLRNRSDAALSHEATAALDDWLVHYLTGRLDPGSMLAAYRDEQRALLPR